MTLFNDDILAKPMDRDWSEGYAETWNIVAPDFEIFEAEQIFEFCDGFGHSLTDDPRELSREELIEGLESISIACYDKESDELLAAAYGDSMIAGDLGPQWLDWTDICREAFEEHSFPMMNYAYPVTIRNDMDLNTASQALIDLPLTLIENEAGDIEHFLALTGGGMDLSAEICKAYIALGQRPPAHFCSVPRMAGRKYSQDFISILIESCRIANNWNESTIRDLENLAADSDYSETKKESVRDLCDPAYTPQQNSD